MRKYEYQEATFGIANLESNWAHISYNNYKRSYALNDVQKDYIANLKKIETQLISTSHLNATPTCGDDYLISGQGHDYFYFKFAEWCEITLR